MPSGLSSFNISPSLVSIRVGKRILWLMPYQGDIYHEDEDFKRWRTLLNLAPSLYKMVSVQRKQALHPQKSSKGLIKAHGGALTGHVGINKTLEILKEHFYWPKMVGMFIR